MDPRQELEELRRLEVLEAKMAVQAQTRGGVVYAADGRVVYDPKADLTNAEIEAPNRLERLGAGAMDMARGIKQWGLTGQDAVTGGHAADDYASTVNDELALYDRGRGPDAGFDWFRAAGRALAGAPLALIPGAGAASLVGRMAAGAGQGALEGALAYEPDGALSTAKLTNTVAGGAAGALMPAAITGATKAATYAGGKAMDAGRTAVRAVTMPESRILQELQPVLDDAGVRLDDLGETVKRNLIAEAKQQLDTTGALDPVALVRKAEAAKWGFTGDLGPTRAQVLRDPAEWTWERNLANATTDETAPLRNRFIAQDQRLHEAARGLQGSQGARTEYEAGAALLKAAQRKDKVHGRYVNQLYGKARNALGNDDVIPTDDFLSQADEILNDFEDVIPAPVKKRLAEFRPGEDGASLRNLTVEEAEKFRKLINARLRATDDKATTEGLRRLGRVIDDAEAALGQASDEAAPLFAKARQAASQRFRTLEPATVQKLVNGELAPENTVKALTTSSIDELKELKRYLTEGASSTHGQQAWTDLKRQVMEQLIQKATQGKGERGEFSGPVLAKALDTMKPERLAVLFEPDELAQLQSLARTAQTLTETPKFAAVNRSNTAPTLLAYMSRLGRGVPGLSAASDVIEDMTQQQRLAAALQGRTVNPEAVQMARRQQAQALAQALSQFGVGQIAGAALVNEAQR